MNVGTHQLIKVLWLGTFIAIGEHEELGVAVEGDEGFDFAVTLDEVHYGFHFNFRVGLGSMVRIRARAATGSRSWSDEEEEAYLGQ